MLGKAVSKGVPPQHASPQQHLASPLLGRCASTTPSGLAPSTCCPAPTKLNKLNTNASKISVVPFSTNGLAVTASGAAPVQPVAPDSSLLKGRFRISADEVQNILQQRKISIEELLYSLIQPASRLAAPHISGFQVGSLGLGGSGAVYVGVNVEFPGVPLNNSIHAEQCLLVNCLHHGETEIKVVSVSAAPCGHCRQFFSEIANADTIEFLFGADATPKSLHELLPERFGPLDLISDEPFPLLLSRQATALQYTSEAIAAAATRAGDEPFQLAASEALAEARQCYAPYTKCHSGASIITRAGVVFSGGCIESAAYNPTLSPFHAAVVDALTNFMPGYDQIGEVVLAERRGAPVEHEANIRLLLSKVAPGATLTVLHIE